jgi:uncharacterized protein (TIGR00159 family)
MLLNLTVFDVIDILLVAIILFQFYRLIRGTAAFSIFLAIFFIYIFWLVVKALNMELVGSLLGQVIGVGVIALIVVFQQEIRMFLLIMGNRYINGSRFPFNKFSGSVGEIPGRHKEAVEIVRAAESMSLKKIGALIVIGRTSRLDIFSEGGEKLKALISAELLETIFVKNSPLHDGAVLIEDGLILAARCPLPLTDQVSLPASYGMRHRAAIGMSEHSDAIIVVISEETGQITVVQTGLINVDITANELREILSKEKL